MVFSMMVSQIMPNHANIFLNGSYVLPCIFAPTAVAEGYFPFKILVWFWEAMSGCGIRFRKPKFEVAFVCLLGDFLWIRSRGIHHHEKPTIWENIFGTFSKEIWTEF